MSSSICTPFGSANPLSPSPCTPSAVALLKGFVLRPIFPLPSISSVLDSASGSPHRQLTSTPAAATTTRCVGALANIESDLAVLRWAQDVAATTADVASPSSAANTAAPSTPVARKHLPTGTTSPSASSSPSSIFDSPTPSSSSRSTTPSTSSTPDIIRSKIDALCPRPRRRVSPPTYPSAPSPSPKGRKAMPAPVQMVRPRWV